MLEIVRMVTGLRNVFIGQEGIINRMLLTHEPSAVYYAALARAAAVLLVNPYQQPVGELLSPFVSLNHQKGLLQ